jgi:two-component system, LytTR family, sensor kinase
MPARPLTSSYMRFLLYPLIGFGTIHLFSLDAPVGSRSYFINGIVSTFYTTVLWEGNQWIVRQLKKRYPTYQQTSQRILLQIILSLIFTISTVAMMTLLLNLLTGRVFDWGQFAYSFRPSLLITFAVTAVAEASYFYNRWKSSILEAEKLKRETIQSQYETLKNQVNPHFLFNSLNTLITLIPENPQMAVSFTQHLSALYRYILQTKEWEVVTLAEEMKIAEAYIFLLKARFGNNLTVQINIPLQDLSLFVPPLTVQLLLENAVKHNIISADKPLHILIYSQHSNWVVVENNLQKKLTPSPDSTQTGLANIINRYKLLCAQSVEVLASLTSFTVKLPLLAIGQHQKYINNKSIRSENI